MMKISILTALLALTACAKIVNVPLPTPGSPNAPTGNYGRQEIEFTNSSSSWKTMSPTKFERPDFDLPYVITEQEFPQTDVYYRLVFISAKDGSVCVYERAMDGNLYPDNEECELAPPILLQMPPESNLRFYSAN